MLRVLPHLPFGENLSEARLEAAGDWELEQMRNRLWNQIEDYEDKIKKSRQSDVKLTYELDLNDAMVCMAQLKKELTRRKQLRPKDKSRL